MAKDILKKVASDDRTRQKTAKKRSLRAVNEHFEQFFNAVISSAVVFQMFPKLLAILMVFALGVPVMAQQVPETIAGASTINVLQARILYEQGALFVDVRPQREWSWGHVQGATHLDINSRFAHLATATIARDIPLVVYCDSDVSPRSAEAVRKAVSWGYSQVYFFRSGYFAWQLVDFPLGKGESDDSQLYAMSTGVKRYTID